MSDYTQDEQREKWFDLAETTLSRINVINANTPAKPTEEPEWWVDMINVRTKLSTAIVKRDIRNQPTRQPAEAETEDDTGTEGR